MTDAAVSAPPAEREVSGGPLEVDRTTGTTI